MTDIETKPPELTQELINEIGAYLLEGLNEEESCILVGYDYSLFKIIRDNSEKLRNFLKKKEVEFKREHLKTISGKKSDKNSMYLLEKLRPAEFGSKRAPNESDVDIISLILNKIQNNGQDQTPLVHEGSYRTAGGKLLEGNDFEIIPVAKRLN